MATSGLHGTPSEGRAATIWKQHRFGGWTGARGRVHPVTHQLGAITSVPS